RGTRGVRVLAGVIPGPGRKVLEAGRGLFVLDNVESGESQPGGVDVGGTADAFGGEVADRGEFGALGPAAVCTDARALLGPAAVCAGAAALLGDDGAGVLRPQRLRGLHEHERP